MSDNSSLDPKQGGTWTVEGGDTVDGIADSTGHFWQTIWNDPDNAGLKQARDNRNVLIPGDDVHVPPLREKAETGATDLVHQFKRKGVPIEIKFTVETQSGEVFAGKPYRLQVGKRIYEGETDEEGRIQRWIAPSAKAGLLTVWLQTDGYPETFKKTLGIGYLQPVTTDEGIRSRLQNLGYLGRDVDTDDSDALIAALSRFQATAGLDETGEADPETQQKLRGEHGT